MPSAFPSLPAGGAPEAPARPLPGTRPVEVYKFGGTSVATPERIARVVALVAAEPATLRRVVVVSALGGVTDALLRATNEALARTDGHRALLDALRRRHDDALAALALPGEQARLQAELAARWQDLAELLDGIYLLRECTPRARDAVIGMGERLSAPLVAAAFRAAGHAASAHDASAFVRTDATFGEANVLFEATYALTQDYFAAVPEDEIAVVTGFIGATERGVLTTLGRSGSDYTATLVAAALQAERAVIWTDVDGVLSADPRLVPEAFSLAQLSYHEAAELAYFGAKVLHPRTMRPLQERRTPLLIKNTLNPSAPGTLIAAEAAPGEGTVKAVTAIRDVAIVMLEGAGMVGVPGISARAFAALAARGINVLMISQGSSEQNICIVVREQEAQDAGEALEAAFELELARGDVSRVTTYPACAVISAVGDRMRQRPGLAGRMFSTLGRSGVNVLAIAQGAAETNISAVVHGADARHAVRALHEAFALARSRAHVFLIGAGVVGRTLLSMMQAQAPRLLEEMSLNLQLVGLANSQRMIWDVEGIPLAEAASRLATAERPTDLDHIVEHLLACRLERLIVVDATASDAVAARYPELLEHNIAVVTPNKRANTQDYAFYERLQRAGRRRQVPYLYETTVGAGLPVLSTLRDLRRAGDRIVRIEGVFSGTLAYLFSELSAGRLFSETVRTARARGYTEPDPRDDLRGEDVARKLLILAREMGYPAERAEVAVESLVPFDLLNTSVEEFMDRLSEVDALWQARVDEAAAAGTVLRYVGLIEEGRLSVRVRAAGMDSPFSRLYGTDNMVAFTTERYRPTPLVVQGPGAGPDVTAAGILADLVYAAELIA